MAEEIRNLDEAFAFFEARTNLEKGIPPGNPNRVYRLDRMRELCAAFNNPQESFRSIHLAGSKGKGSTGAYIAALLTSAGRRVGVYASPHLRDYRERFRIEGEEFPEETGFKTAKMLLKKLPEIEGGLPGEGGATTFELLTLFSFLLFRESGCDTAVLETGLGGRLDATNVIKKPEAVVFTPIEKEHTDVLGHRLKDIAAEKAGIIKSFPGAKGLSSFQRFSSRRVIRKKAENNGIELHELSSEISRISEEKSVSESSGLFTWKLKWKNGKEEEISLNMGGKIQAENAALALLTARSIEPKKSIDAASLADVSLPGRFQFLRKNPAVILDGAHTPQSIATLAEAFMKVAGSSEKNPPILLFGSVEGKDHKTMAKKLCGGRNPYFHEVIISTPGSFKLSSPEKVAESFRKTRAAVSLITDPGEAWATALERSGGKRPILVTGSFFMAGEIAALAD